MDTGAEGGKAERQKNIPRNRSRRGRRLGSEFLSLEMLNILIRKRKADPDLAVKGIEIVMAKL